MEVFEEVERRVEAITAIEDPEERIGELNRLEADIARAGEEGVEVEVVANSEPSRRARLTAYVELWREGRVDEYLQRRSAGKVGR